MVSWEGAPTGGWLPARGRSPSGGCGSPPQGQGPFLFLRKKKRALTPKKNEAGLRGVGTGKTAACVFTHCLGTSPGRYGHAIGEQGQTVVLSCGRLDVPLSRQSAVVAWRVIAPHTTLPLHLRRREAPDHPGPERGTRRRRVDRAQACPCFTRAGRNGRKGSFLSYERRQPPFSTRNLP